MLSRGWTECFISVLSNRNANVSRVVDVLRFLVAMLKKVLETDDMACITILSKEHIQNIIIST